MKITGLIVLILINQSLAGGGGKHHVHFKIHVPDVIKHHIHTKTVFIHVHAGHDHGGGGKKKMVPKKKETHHEESHHEDWSSWSSYDDHDSHGNGHEHKHHGTKDVKTSGKGPVHGTKPHTPGHGAHLTLGGHGQGYGQGYGHGHGYDYTTDPYGNIHSQMLAYDPRQLVNMQMQDIHSDFIGGNAHPVPPQQNKPNPYGGGGHRGQGLVGYSYPPQYGMHQNLGDVREVKETLHNDIAPYNEAYEEGYRKGHQSETGHIVSEDLNDFYDNKHEEGDLSNDAYDSQSFDNYKNLDESNNHDTEAADHNGYNYHDGANSYLSSFTDSR